MARGLGPRGILVRAQGRRSDGLNLAFGSITSGAKKENSKCLDKLIKSKIIQHVCKIRYLTKSCILPCVRVLQFQSYICTFDNITFLSTVQPHNDMPHKMIILLL